MGKHHISLLELEPDELHEEEAGLRIAKAVRGAGLVIKGPSEGRFDLFAEQAGVLKIDARTLLRINRIPQIALVTLHNHTPVKEGERVAGAKVVPLVIKEKFVNRVERHAEKAFPVISIAPFKKVKVGGVITGREVCEERIADGFGPVLRDKAAAFGLEEPALTYVGDEKKKICRAILDHLENGCELILVTGGMSVDPDDVTPAGIRMTGAKIIRYGAPVMPGVMFLMAYKGSIPIIEFPLRCMRHNHLDLLCEAPGGEKKFPLTRSSFRHGGLCRSSRNAFIQMRLEKAEDRVPTLPTWPLPLVCP